MLVSYFVFRVSYFVFRVSCFVFSTPAFFCIFPLTICPLWIRYIHNRYGGGGSMNNGRSIIPSQDSQILCWPKIHDQSLRTDVRANTNKNTQNKPNSRGSTRRRTSVRKKSYGDFAPCPATQNKPNQTQFSALLHGRATCCPPVKAQSVRCRSQGSTWP